MTGRINVMLVNISISSINQRKTDLIKQDSNEILTVLNMRVTFQRLRFERNRFSSESVDLFDSLAREN